MIRQIVELRAPDEPESVDAFGVPAASAGGPSGYSEGPLGPALPLSGPMFRKVVRWGRLGSKAIMGRTVADMVKRTASAAGLDPALYAGHSLRRA